jgi:DUF4097 and DUF4098 domain-containing protein YvlB
MKFMTSTRHFRLLAPLAVALTTSLGFCGADSVSIHRGEIRRQGEAWTEQIQCHIPANPGERLTLRASPGSVHVATDSPQGVNCQVRLAAYSRDSEQAKRCLDSYELKALRAGGGASVEGRLSCGRPPGWLNAHFDVHVPLKFNLDLRTQGGNVDIANLDGQLAVESAGGDIHTGDISGPVTVSTSGGMINLGNIGQNVEARTAGGNIRVRNVNGNALLDTRGGQIMAGIVNGLVRAETGGGDIILQAASGPVVVETAGGQIHLGQCGNTVRAQTAGGNIQVAGARGGVKVQTAGGSIDLLQAMSSILAQTSAGRILAQIDANRSTFGPSRLETQVGDVDVFLPPTLPVSINASIAHALGHRIVSDFPLKIQKDGGNFMIGPVRGEGAVNGGGSALVIHTLMGNIQIRKLDPAAVAQLKSLQQDFWKQWQENERQRAMAFRQFEDLQRRLERQRTTLEKQLQQSDAQRAAEIEQQLESQRDALQKQLQEIYQVRFEALEQQLENQREILRKQLRKMNRQLQQQIQEGVQNVDDERE